MRFLWLSPRWPFPADDGAKQASASLLLSLAKAGHEISVVSFARESSLLPSPTSSVKLLAHYHPRPESRAALAIRNLPSSLPVSALPFTGFGISWNGMRDLLKGRDPDAVVVDGAHAFASFLSSPCPWPIIYRAHNVEASLWEQSAARSSFPMNLYYALQAKRMNKFETGLVRASVGVAAISQDDANEFQKRSPGTRACLVPMGFEFDEALKFPTGPLTFGFLGRLDWPPNREGLEWFLEKVWLRVKERRPGVKFLVAGSGNDGWLDRYPTGYFEKLGRIPDVHQFYENVHVPIAPMHYGSGTKIKVIEAARFGRAVIATPESMHGSGLKDSSAALISSDPEQWVEQLVNCSERGVREVGQRAFEDAQRIFSASEATMRFLALLS